MSSRTYHSVVSQPIVHRARSDQLIARALESPNTSLRAPLHRWLRRALEIVRAALTGRRHSSASNDLSQFNEHMLRDIGAPERLIAVAAEREGAFCCFPCDITPRRQLFY